MFPLKYLAEFYTKDNVMDAFQNFIFGGNSGHLWFLIALFWCFILFYPLEKYIFRKNFFIGLLVTCFIYNCSGLLVGLPMINSIPGLERAIVYLPYFIGGFVLEDIRRKTHIHISVKIILTCVFAMMSCIQFEKAIFTNVTIIAVLGSLTIYFVAYWITTIPKLTELRIYRCLLKNSMYIYLFHEPFNFIMLRWAINNNIVVSETLSAIYFAGRTLGSIVLAVVLGQIVDYIRQQKICSVLIREKVDL